MSKLDKRSIQLTGHDFFRNRRNTYEHRYFHCLLHSGFEITIGCLPIGFCESEERRPCVRRRQKPNLETRTEAFVESWEREAKCKTLPLANTVLDIEKIPLAGFVAFDESDRDLNETTIYHALRNRSLKG